MHIKKIILLLLNLEIAFGTETIQTYSDGTDTQTAAEQPSVSKRNSAYKRLPGWKVFYGKRSSDPTLDDKQDLYSLHDPHDLRDLLERASNSEQITDPESVENSGIADSVNLSDAVYDDSKESDLLQSNYDLKAPHANLIDVVQEIKNRRNILDSNSEDGDDEMEESKRSGWNAIYGKRMPGWYVGYGKRSEYLNDDEKRAPAWLATYGKRAPQWLATYGKRAPQWLATYGRRAPQWQATYGKRAPQWLATYGKRAPAWLATYGKRAPAWLATYGKRAPQWLATYGKRAPGWLATYGKRSDLSNIKAIIRQLDELHRRRFIPNEQINAMPERLPGWNAGYRIRDKEDWAAL